MKERPILFSEAMVRAILEGRKTQTRRAVKPQPVSFGNEMIRWMPAKRLPGNFKKFPQPGISWYPSLGHSFPLDYFQKYCPYGQPGDRLWVRETWDLGENGAILFRAGQAGPGESWVKGTPYRRWHPSIHMPRKASRILLEITSIRAERVADISRQDAFSEGIIHDGDWYRAGEDMAGWQSPQDAFAGLWMDINGVESYRDNPWVWVIEFRRV